MHIKIGSRGSKLALWQSEYVSKRITDAFTHVTCEIVIIKTKGDKIQNVSLQKIGDKGLFVKEIEEQLLNGSIDIAVHSMKDMPSILPESLIFTKALKREDARDVLILKNAKSIKELKENAIIGTGSMRRATQIKKLRPDVIIKDIRGNVDTRLRKLEEEDYDGIVMAAAGLKRLGLEAKITQYLDFEEMVPACAQGCLAIELKEENKELLSMLNTLCDEESHECVEAERYYLASMEGNCHIPVGGHCVKEEDKFAFYAVYGKDDTRIITTKTVHEKALEAAKMASEEVKKAMVD